MEHTSISSPVKKRKHKDDDGHSSKKRKHHDEALASTPKKSKKDKHRKHKDDTKPTPPESQVPSFESIESSPFHLVKTTLYLSVSPICISDEFALSGLLSEHITPLLLTYYPPVRGVVLAFSNPSLSSSPFTVPKDALDPTALTLAVSGGEYGVLYVYLTVTLLVFRPERGQALEGWINVQSEGFLGAVVHNLFSIGIDRKRLPPGWKWIAPGQQPPDRVPDEEDSNFDIDKDGFRPLTSGEHIPNDYEDEASAATGYFMTGSGKRVRGMIKFRVKDVDVIPGSEHDKGFISLEGTMLSPEEEAKLITEEKRRAMLSQKGVVDFSVNKGDDVMVSGGLVGEHAASKSATGSTEKTKKKKKKSKD
ncbi:hypothetical protein LOZ36_003361 [Ophidiomyces ophidiicola]|nr:hypothetical protein LOZ36_003361 [Ophidiomyces ophidiicola]